MEKSKEKPSSLCVDFMHIVQGAENISVISVLKIPTT
jgi:hypothetical protein